MLDKAIACVWPMIGACLLAACQAQPSAPEPRGNDDLGIAEFRTTETADRLDLEGLDAAGTVIASLRLRTGHVEVMDEQLAGEGRELVATVDGIEAKHVSVGSAPLALPQPEDKPMSLFLNDPYVADHLAGWGITLAVSAEGLVPSAEETAYTHNGSCTGFVPPCNGTAVTSCCLQHADASSDRFQRAVCGNMPTATRAERKCEGPSAVTACGTAGPAGCAVCWSTTYNKAVEAYATAYTSGTDSCGFTIPLTLTATCDVSSGGLVGSASVYWNGNTVTCFYGGPTSVSQTFWIPQGSSQTITHSSSWFVGWSGGGCSGVGSCTKTFNTKTTVTGAFDKDTCPTC